MSVQRRLIQSATRGHGGARNDKTIVRFDSWIHALKTDPQYTTYKYQLYRSDGTIRLLMGLYQLVDGGYHLWRVLQCPLKHTADVDKARWSKQLESVRKDSECVFGILKGRFRILKIPLLFHKIHQIDNIFYTCCVLHNMLLINDGMDIPAWEEGVDWAHLDGLLGVAAADEDEYEEDEAADLAQVQEGNQWGLRGGNQTQVRLTADSDYSICGGNSFDYSTCDQHGSGDSEVAVEVETSHNELRSALIEHFTYMWKHKEVHWIGPQPTK